MNTDIFIDASILLSILDEDEFLPKILTQIEPYENIWISPVSYLFGFERCRRKRLSTREIYNTLSFYEVAKIDQPILEKAKSICSNYDFEDALQVASCLDKGVKNFLTNDFKQAKR